LPSAGLLGPATAKGLLADVAGYRQRARRPPVLWPPLVVFGVIAAVDAPISMRGPLAANAWWLVAGPVGFVIVGLLMSRQAYHRGIENRSWRLPALGVASFVVAFAGLWLSGVLHLPGALGWVLLVALSYLAWSRFARSLPVAAVAVSMAAVGIALTVSPAPGWTVELGVGVTMIFGGLVLRHGPEAAPADGSPADGSPADGSPADGSPAEGTA
jgi:hypothetical protein